MDARQEKLVVERVDIADQKNFYGAAFPLTLVCRSSSVSRDDVQAWIEANRDELLAGANEHGVVLFRGFPLATAEDFDGFIARFELKNFPYDQSLSNAVRVNYTERVFSANEAPPDVTIFLHHEMAQTPIYPSRLFFFCQQPAETGGATPICRSDALLEKLAVERPDFVDACEQRGLKYTNVMPPENDFASGMGRSWRSTLRAESREEAESRLRELGYTWQWLSDGSLRVTTPVLPAVRTLPSGRRSFFNQLIAAFAGWKDSRNDPSRAITLGDGTPLDADAVRHAIALAEEFTVDLAWQAGDVALVDNFVAMHGRRTFSGTRKVLASLVAADA